MKCFVLMVFVVVVGVHGANGASISQIKEDLEDLGEDIEGNLEHIMEDEGDLNHIMHHILDEIDANGKSIAQVKEIIDQGRPTPLPPHQLVRIGQSGNYNVSKGILQVWAKGQWGAILDEAPGAFANVACKMLGFKKGWSDPSEKTGQIDGLKILFDWIDCDGTEESIFDCKLEAAKEEEPKDGYFYANVDCE